MATPTARQAAASILASVVSLALAAPQVLMTGTMLIDLRRVTRGMVAWAGLFSLVFLACGALALTVALPAWYWEGSRDGTLRHRFFRVLAILCLLYPVLHLLSNIEFSFRYVSRCDYVIGGAGLVLGILFTVLAVRARDAAGRRSDRAPTRGPDRDGPVAP